MADNIRKLIIIGSGPAGLTAAIYAARAELKPLVLGGLNFGGQLMLTSEVGNYPGFADDILGPELMGRMLEQAKRFGAEVILDDVTRADLTGGVKKIYTHDKEFLAEAAILATGASTRWLGLLSEERLRGKGVSSCATCDGFFFKGKKVAVVGGGDSAMEEALFLTKFATEVFVIHRRDTLKASKIMQSRAKANPKIKFIWDSGVEEILGQASVTGVKIKNLKTGGISELPVEGIFVAIGHEPNTKFLAGSGVDLDEKGYIIVKDSCQTNLAGVFAAGDVHDHVYRQAITAAGAGAQAAIIAERWLSEKNPLG